jgi:hypothetical protein
MPPDGGPFDLIRCGLDALAARIAAENALGVVQAKLSLRLATATQAVDDARAACRVRKTGRAKRTLGKVTRALGQVVKILRSRKAREVPEVLRTELTADGKAILGDVVLVKVGLVCP